MWVEIVVAVVVVGWLLGEKRAPHVLWLVELAVALLRPRAARDRWLEKYRLCCDLLPTVVLEHFAVPFFLVERDRASFWVVAPVVGWAANLALEANQEGVVRHWLAAIFAAFGYFDLAVVLVTARKGFARVKTDFEAAVVREQVQVEVKNRYWAFGTLA